MKWATFFQNPLFLEMTRKFLIDPELTTVITKKCGIKENMKVLDVGCGTGFFSRFFTKNTNICVTGLDREKEFIEEAIKKNVSKNINYVLGDALEMPFEDNSFDIIISHTFFTSISDPLKAIREMKRVCKPEGYINSVTSMQMNPTIFEEGDYPLDLDWYDKLSYLEKKAWIIYEKIDPMKNYLGFLETSKIPVFFSNSNLKNVSIFPIGKCFSLSDASISYKDKREYIIGMSSSRKEKINQFMKLDEFKYYFSLEEYEEYISLLEKEKEYHLENIHENFIWHIEGGANLLVTGKNVKAMIPEEHTYKKHKDSNPEDTIKHIEEILSKLDIKTSITWQNSEMFNCYSNRLSINNTPFGVNGKGTSLLFTKASAYAELIERMQNSMLFFGVKFSSKGRYKGIEKYPDEKILKIDELLKEDTSFIKHIFKEMKIQGYFEKHAFMENYRYIACEEKYNGILGIPFVNLNESKVEYLPAGLVEYLYGSNGMSAGNTTNEALVQGMAEVFERYVTYKIINEKTTPPSIEKKYFKKYPELWETICKIERKGYSVIVKDCSFGGKYPVIATIILNKENGKFGIKFGSHPSFPIALERTLTEAFQGRKLEELVSYNMIGTDEQVYGRDNITNIFKISSGFYPKELFSNNFSYEFKEFENVEEKSNSEMLKSMFKILLKEEKTIYIRDVSFLGFKSYMILIPGVTELYPIDKLRFKELLTSRKVRTITKNLSEATKEELEVFVRYFKFKLNSIFENNAGILLGLPLSDKFPANEFGGIFMFFLALFSLKKYDEASNILAYIIKNIPDTYNKKYYYCLNTYLKLLNEDEKINKNELESILFNLHDEDSVLKVATDFFEGNIFRNIYGKMNCPNCDACEFSCFCMYKKAELLINKLTKAYFNNPVSQENFCELLTPFIE